MLKTTRKKRHVKPARASAPVVFCHLRPQYRTPSCRRPACGYAELGDDRMVRLFARGRDASAGFVVVDCESGDSYEVEGFFGRYVCDCRAATVRPSFGGPSPCVHARGIEALAREGAL